MIVITHLLTLERIVILMDMMFAGIFATIMSYDNHQQLAIFQTQIVNIVDFLWVCQKASLIQQTTLKQ